MNNNNTNNSGLYRLRCEITSREYCDFMKGYFHEEATLCSQVRLSLVIAHIRDIYFSNGREAVQF